MKKDDLHLEPTDVVGDGPVVSAVNVITINQGDDIPDDFYALVDWTPILGSLLVSGIYLSQTKFNGQFWPYYVTDIDELKWYDTIENTRLIRARYVYQQWSQSHSGLIKTVSPKNFLTWFNTVEVPPLGFDSKPLPKPQPLMPGDILRQPISEPHPTVVDKSSPVQTKRRRRDVLTDIIERAVKDAETDSANAVYIVLKKYAEKQMPPLCGLEGNVIQYKYEKENEKDKWMIVKETFDINMLRKRLARRRLWLN